MLNNLMFGTLALFWGGSFIAIKNLIHDVPSFTGAFYRVFFSLLFLLIIYATRLTWPKNVNYKELVMTAMTGLFSVGIPFSLLFWGEMFVSPSIAGVINGTVPFWTLIVGILFFSGMKDITFKKVFGLILGFAGLICIFGPKLNFSGEMSEIYGLFAIIGMAVSYSIGINLNKNLLVENKQFTGKLNLVVQQFSAMIYLALVVLVTDGVPDLKLLLVPANGLAVLYLSLFSTCIAFIIFYKLIEEVGPIKASTVTFFVPPIALLLDNLVYGTKLSILECLGALIILCSMILLKQVKPPKEEDEALKLPISQLNIKL